jgi:hypothetical protein
MLLKPEDLQEVKVSSLLSVVTNTGLGLVSSPHEEAEEARRHNGTGMIYVSLGIIMEPLAIFTTTISTDAKITRNRQEIKYKLSYDPARTNFKIQLIKERSMVYPSNYT